MAELYDKCLKVGLRMTLPRKVILEVIESSEDHPDVEEMYRRAVEKDRSISIATVYRTIKLFEEAGYNDTEVDTDESLKSHKIIDKFPKRIL